jgi:fatty acid desaturase
LSALQAEFRVRGYYRKPTGRIVTQLALHLLTACAGLALLLATDSPLLAAVGMALFSAGQIGVATNTHTSAHYATSHRRWVNRALTYLGYPLFMGLGATYWWHKHNVRHHGSPNVIEIDEDAQLRPWFAFTQADVRAAGPLLRFYYRVQWVLLPAIALMGLQLQLNSLRHLGRVVWSRQRFGLVHWLDLGMLALYWGLWVGVPLLFLPVASVLIFTVLRLVIVSVALFSIFSPAHVPAEASAVQHAMRGSDPVRLQTATTLNFRTGWLGRWLISGLQHQIEHHLFPGISHVHYPAMSPLLASYCARHGYPYRTLGWGEALWKTLGNFLRPKDLDTSLAEPA